MAQRHQLATEVRDSIEIAHTSEYQNFLKSYFRVFWQVLTQITKPQLTDSADHKVRNVILEILNRLPHNEVLRPYVFDLLKLSHAVMASDNEENGIIALRIMFDLHKNFRPSLENEVQLFLDYVNKAYQNFKATVSYFFEENLNKVQVQQAGQLASQLAASQGISYVGQRQVGTSGPIPGQLNPANRSFKLINDCPLIVMFLLQLYPRFVAANIPILLPLMVQSISISGPQQVPHHLKPAYADLKGAQIKTLSFLTYILRSHFDYIKPHEESISKSIVNLLVTCPDLVSHRKSEAAIGGQEQGVLVGAGRACYETLRPLGFSLLAELIHNFRGDLSLAQLARIVYVFSRNVHDASLPTSVQTTCVRLMLNLVETIFSRRVDQQTREEGRTLLGKILDAFVTKFSNLRRNVTLLLEGDVEEKKGSASLRLRLELPVQSALSLMPPPGHAKEVADCKALMRTLIMGLKTLIWSITYFNQTSQQPGNSLAGGANNAKGMREDEAGTSLYYRKHALKFLRVCLAGVLNLKGNLEAKQQVSPGQLSTLLLTAIDPSRRRPESGIAKVDLGVKTKTQLMAERSMFKALLMAVIASSGDAEIQDGKDEFLHNVCRHFAMLFHIDASSAGAQPGGGATSSSPLRPLPPAPPESASGPAAAAARGRAKQQANLKELDPLIFLDALVAVLADENRKHAEAALGGLDVFAGTLILLARSKHTGVVAPRGGVGTPGTPMMVSSPSMNPVLSPPPSVRVPVFEQLLPRLLHCCYGGTWQAQMGGVMGLGALVGKVPVDTLCAFQVKTVQALLSVLKRLPQHAFKQQEEASQAGTSLYYRKHALKFLRVCLAGVLNLKGNLEAKQQVSPGQLSTLLLTAIDPSRRRPESGIAKVDLGVKTKTQLMAERSMFKALLMAVIASSGDAEIQDGKDEFLHNVCRHFAMLFHIDASSAGAQPGGGATSSSPLRPLPPAPPESASGPAAAAARGRAKQQANLKELDPLIFLDALVAVLADENRKHAEAALGGLDVFAGTLILLARSKHTGVVAPRGGVGTPGTPMMVSSPSMNPVLSPPPSVRVPVFEQLLPRLLHCCYGGTWQAQMGGVMGLGALVGKVPVDTLCAFQVKTVQALLSVLKRLPQHAFKQQEEASQVLTQVLRVVNNVDESNNEQRKQSFQGVVDVLASELFNPNAMAIVRKNVQSCLGLLASRTGQEVSELLERVHAPLLQPLLQRPLRLRHYEQQVGTMMALNYCLSLRPPLVRLTPELINILQEALVVADADESMMPGKFANARMAPVYTKLRTVSIELLCTALALADLKQPTHSDLRAKVIAMFFKSLTCRTPEIVAVAKEGLRQVINQQKLPKELLQSSLRPILVNLAHYKNLNMPLLQTRAATKQKPGGLFLTWLLAERGLARLLELLSNWFNVTLGEKLLEHLKKWLEPEKLAQQVRAWKAGEEPKVAAAIIELFHLLPPAAVKFLDSLVVLTIQLEVALPPGSVHSELNSPYRPPLTKFLNRYASEAVDYFLARLIQPPFFRRLVDIIRSEAGQSLREELSKSSEKIIHAAFSQSQLPSNDGGMASANGTEVQLQGVALVSALVKLMPEWLPNNRPMFDALVRLWRSPQRKQRLLHEQELPLSHVKESKRVVKCFLNYLRHNRAEVDVLFDMLSIFLSRTRIDFTFLREFYFIELPEGYSGAEKKAVLLRFLVLFQQKAIPQELSVIALQLLILPLLQYAFEHGQAWEVVDAAIIKTIVEQLLDPPEDVGADYDEPLRIELLQLATLLIRHLPNDLRHHRKELIKFGWNHLKREESASKQWAFVNVCHFLEAYQAPEKIILQPDTRVLVKQALDVLMPALPQRLPIGDAKIPIWIRYTKKILVEEGHSLLHLIHIFQLLVRHADLFYASRAQFVPQMVNSLVKLGLPSAAVPENRKLAIDLAGLVISWEERRVREARPPAGNAGDDGGGTAAQATPAEGDQLKTEAGEGGGDGDSVAAGGGGQLAGTKRSADTAGLAGGPPEEAMKRTKAEPGVGVAGGGGPHSPSDGAAAAAAGAGGMTGGPEAGGGGAAAAAAQGAGARGGPAEEEFRPNSGMEDMIVNFLIRVSFMVEPKDKDSTAMYKQALALLERALEAWPNVSVKISYMERLLQQQQQQQQAAAAAAQAVGGQAEKPLEVPHGLKTALDVLLICLTKQPQPFVRNNVQQIIKVLEMSFTCASHDGTEPLCRVLKMAMEAFPSLPPDDPAAAAAAAAAAPPPDLHLLQKRVEELLHTHLMAVVQPPLTVPARDANCVIACALHVIRTLCEARRHAAVDKLLEVLVRAVQRLARELHSTALNMRGEAEKTGDVEVRRTVDNLKLALQLVGRRVLHVANCRRQFGALLHTLLGERTTDSGVLLTILDIIADWVDSDFRAVSGVGGAAAMGALTSKDVITFLVRLAGVDRSLMSAEVAEQWESKFLRLLHRLCADASKYSQAVRNEVFQKVERVHCLGLRARDPELRQAFFALYNESVGRTLFLRLQYVISVQDWEALGDQFWLKQGLDLLLSILVEHEPINLAPNQAQVPPLMASGGVSERQGMSLPGGSAGGTSGSGGGPGGGSSSGDAAEEAEGTAPTFVGLVNKHARFLNEINHLQLAVADPSVAYHLWVLVFPIVWATLQKDEQVMLAKPMVTLLSKEYHIKQVHRRPNVVQALLEGIRCVLASNYSDQRLQQLGYRDKAWSVNKLAYMARKHGLPEVCKRVLNSYYGFPSMEVQEAFVKIREEAKADIAMRGGGEELAAGLASISTCNLDYFPVAHKAEIWRLKGEMYQRMGEGENANQAYATAISLFRHHPKGWVSWGNYCDQLLLLVLQLPSNARPAAHRRRQAQGRGRVYKETGEQAWLEFAVACLLQGVRYGSSQGRNYLARVLYLLSFDNGKGTVGRAFDKHTPHVPFGVWLVWIPQLLLSLQRPENPHVKLVLISLAHHYPQTPGTPAAADGSSQPGHAGGSQGGPAGPQQMGESGMGPSRAATPTQSGAEPSTSGRGQVMDGGGTADVSSQGAGPGAAAGSGHPSADGGAQLALLQPGLRRSASAASWPASALTAFDAAKEVMEQLRLKHANLAAELELMLTDMGSKFVPLPEERLLAVVHALLHRCYKYPTATTGEVPVSLKKELNGVCRACFSADTVNKHTDFVSEYKKDFERDLDPDSTDSFPVSLAELTRRLKHWEGVLQSNVEDRLPGVLKLEEESRHLRDWNVLDIEMPGQYFSDQVDHIGADVPIVRRHGSSHRRLTLVGSDGSSRHFLVQTSLTPSARSDERMVQLFRVINRLLDKHKESRRRNLAFHTPIIIPVWPQVRLVEDEATYSTLAEVYDVNCARYGREADGPIAYFKEKLNSAITNSMSGEALVELRLATYSEVTAKLVSENILSQFMYKSLPTSNHLWTFKKQFAAQLALSGCVSYLLQIGGRSPNKILFAKNTGKVFQTDFHPTYDANGIVECQEPVPFRLTRNIQTFLTHFGTDGLFVAAMCASAQAIVAPKSAHVQHQLAMFFRDDLISWSWRRPAGQQPMGGGGGLSTAELKQKVSANIDGVMERLNRIAPQSYVPEDDGGEGNGAPPVPVSVQKGVIELVEAALRPRNLCLMDPTWHPWF
eukprot:jgi/Mesen1/4981/ME000248S04265